MYRYDTYDRQLVAERVAQYRDQLARYLSGALRDEEFLPLRLQNGLYIQRHAPMLRVAIPYGLLSADQLRALATVAERWDRGYGHFTTRQNIQFNWVRLEETAEILAFLAEHDLHAIQTSGNCIRNITTDALAGVAADERVDPRPWCEFIRQWATFHPEFAFLPRKFKIAVNGAKEDRAAIRAHDIGLDLYPTDDPLAPEFDVYVGGGLGRTPMVGQRLYARVPAAELIPTLEAILRVYNRFGRRDNKYKARIKILLQALGVEAFRAAVDAERVRGDTVVAAYRDGWRHEVARIAAHFAEDDERAARTASKWRAEQAQPTLRDAGEERAFARWRSRNVLPHRVLGFVAVALVTKRHERAPGDVTAEEMRAIADWSERYADGEIRVTHEQNLVLAWVPEAALPALWREVRALGFGRPTFRLATDVISCPGGDYCALANARSIPVAQAVIAQLDRDPKRLAALGKVAINLSGCMNACGHHHLGAIGVLGVDKKGEEWYQITIGGQEGNDLRLGQVIGPSVRAEAVAPAIERLLDTYLALRRPEERFAETVARVGVEPFKTAVYGGESGVSPQQNQEHDHVVA
ncbi:nitrite/sulfite reductase [Hydrogenophilus hirschii]